MSKRDQFKALLGADNNQDTGSSQKIKILNEHLLPNNEDIANKGNGSKGVNERISDLGNTTATDLPATSSGSAHESVLQPTGGSNSMSTPEQLNASKSTFEKTGETSSSSESGIKSIISTLTNSDDLNVEETHSRRTYLIENELLEELERVSKDKKKGYKTKIINTGLRIVLDLMKQNKHDF